MKVQTFQNVNEFFIKVVNVVILNLCRTQNQLTMSINLLYLRVKFTKHQAFVKNMESGLETIIIITHIKIIRIKLVLKIFR